MATATKTSPKNVKPIIKPAAAPPTSPVKTTVPAPKVSAPALITWDDATDFFSAGTDGGRLNTLHYLDVNGETTVSDLCAAMKTSQPAMSHALGLLRMQRMVRARRDGKNVFYTITDGGKRLIVFALDIVNA